MIRSEHARTDEARTHLQADRVVLHGQDIRPRGQECRSGDVLLPATALVTPAVLGLAAAAGYDDLATVARPRVEVLVLGDELLTQGLPHDGLIRDALGPMLGVWLRALGAEVVGTRRLKDDAGALLAAITGSSADLVITTGGTASGPVDHVHPVLHKAGAELLVDGVAVRPGHPMLLAQIGVGKHLVGLPGNPLAAVSGLLTLAEPLLRELAAPGKPGGVHRAAAQRGAGTSTRHPARPRGAPGGRSPAAALQRARDAARDRGGRRARGGAARRGTGRTGGRDHRPAMVPIGLRRRAFHVKHPALTPNSPTAEGCFT